MLIPFATEWWNSFFETFYHSKTYFILLTGTHVCIKWFHSTIIFWSVQFVWFIVWRNCVGWNPLLEFWLAMHTLQSTRWCGDITELILKYMDFKKWITLILDLKFCPNSNVPSSLFSLGLSHMNSIFSDQGDVQNI